MENNDCLFCKIIAGEIPCYKVYEDDKWLAFLDINPINLGHTLLLPKKHHRNLFDLPEDLLGEMGVILQKLSLVIKEATQADGINIGWNNESAAGQLVFHSHTHIMPRFEGDGFTHWKGKGGETKEDFEATQTAIKKTLSAG
ncbi:MAG: HIT family protein [Candidatus Vogelbacteria bacterium]|nr:HIT family protein [Candidatus Vogelbacteria bacterium]